MIRLLYKGMYPPVIAFMKEQELELLKYERFSKPKFRNYDNPEPRYI